MLEHIEPELRADRPRIFKGEGLSEGVAVGRVVLHEPRVKVERMIADNPQEELKRLSDQASQRADSAERFSDRIVASMPTGLRTPSWPST